MIEIEKLLKQHPAVDDYRIVTRDRTSYEMFFVHESLETVRATDLRTAQVTVYVKHDGKLGDSSFELYDSMDEAATSVCIEKAVSRAKLVFNEPYELPSGEAEACELPSNLADAAPADVAAKVARAVFAGNEFENGSINATEIFLYKDTSGVKNSHGVNTAEVKHTLQIEAIPTWNEADSSVELYENVKYMDLDEAEITAEIGRKMREVRDRQFAVKPETPMTCNAVLTGLEISRLLGDLSSQLSYNIVYSHANLFKTGDDLQEGGTGDKLTMTMAGNVPGSAESSAFDADGVRLGEKVLVAKGVVQGYHGSTRYAQYLGEEKATGVMKCVKLEAGSLTAEKLEEIPYLEIVSMSGLQVDLYNNYIGGEIRLAYLHEQGNVTPVTGITMSADLRDVLKNLKLSDRIVTRGNYCGPDKLMMFNVKVL